MGVIGEEGTDFAPPLSLFFSLCRVERRRRFTIPITRDRTWIPLVQLRKTNFLAAKSKRLSQPARIFFLLAGAVIRADARSRWIKFDAYRITTRTISSLTLQTERYNLRQKEPQAERTRNEQPTATIDRQSSVHNP